MKSFKYLSLFFLLLSLSFSISLSAQCGHEPTGEIIGGGRTISSQSELDNFISQTGEKFTMINNRLQLVGGGPDPIVDLCNLSALEVINGALQLEGFGPENGIRIHLPNLVEVKRLKIGDLLGVGNSGIVSFSAPKLERIKGIFTINNNPELAVIYFPELQYIGDAEVGNTTALFLQDNPKLTAAILPKIQAVSGSVNILSGHTALTHLRLSGEFPKASISSWIMIKGDFPALKEASFPEVVMVSGYVDFDGVNSNTSVEVAFPKLARVGEFVSMTSFARRLSFGSDQLRVNGDLRVTKNQYLEEVSIGKTTVRGNVLVQDNEAEFLINAGLVEVGGLLKIATSGAFPVRVELPDLQKVGGALNLINAGQKEVAIGDDLEVLGSLWVQAGPEMETLSIDVKTVGQDFIISGSGSLDWQAKLQNVRVPQLKEVKGNFSISHLPEFRGFQGGSDFGQLQSIGSGESKLEIFANPLVEECCLFSCQVNLNGALMARNSPHVNIFANAGNCSNYGAVLSSCPRNPSTAFSRTTVRRWRRDYILHVADNAAGVSNFSWRVSYDGRLAYTGTQPSLYTPLRKDNGQTEVCLTITSKCGATATHCEKFGKPLPDTGSGFDFEPTAKPKNLNGSVSASGSITAFPNPFDDQLTVRLKSDKAYSIRLFNAMGAQVRELSIAEDSKSSDREVNIPVSGLPAGVYIIQGQSKDGTERVSRKLVKR